MASQRVLWAAWSRVAAGSSVPGVDGVTTERFAAKLDGNLRSLADHFDGGTYVAQPLRPMTANRNGRRRQLAIPTVRDRVAQRCFMEVFERELDARNAEASFAYRKGRSWLDALARVERFRDAGQTWVFRGDIASFFDEIDHDLLADVVSEAIPDPSCTALVRGWVSAPLLGSNGLIERHAGLPQGAPISPCLANLYLTGFDRAIAGRRKGVVRYADDLVVCCADPGSAETVRFDVEQALRPLRLRLNLSKSYVSSFETGFSFLGWTFFRDGGFEESPSTTWVHPMTVARNKARPAGRDRARGDGLIGDPMPPFGPRRDAP